MSLSLSKLGFKAKRLKQQKYSFFKYFGSKGVCVQNLNPEIFGVKNLKVCVFKVLLVLDTQEVQVESKKNVKNCVFK